MENNKEFQVEIIYAGSSCPPNASNVSFSSGPHSFKEIEKGIYFCNKCGMIIKTQNKEVLIKK